MQKYCYNCMRPLDASPICRFCGHSNANRVARTPYHLSPASMLSNRYFIGNALGEGGFGITYIGLDVTLSKRVAVKEFYPSGCAYRMEDSSVAPVSGKEDFFRRGLERFLDEAKRVAAFSDEDGIVDVLDFFQANNTAYIVMEYLDGITLKEYLKTRGRFQPDRLISLMFPMMRSMKLMHARGVIHRDISPDNIMLTNGGKLKLMDFGSARYYSNEEKQMSVVLKNGFAPEEQYRRNSKQGPFTDVYAVCATIYTCITGIVPQNSLDRLNQDNLKPPSTLGVNISPMHERALMHGLGVLAQNRCPDMETLMGELNGTIIYRPPSAAGTVPHNYNDSYNHPQDIRPSQPPEKKKSNAPLIVTIVIAAIAVLAAIITLTVVLLNSSKDEGNNEAQPQTRIAYESSVTTATIDNRAEEETTEEETTEEPTTEEPTTEEPTTLADIDVEAEVEAIRDKYYSLTNSRISPTEINGYDVVRNDDDRLWIAYPSGELKDYDDKQWYFFDENGKLFFIFEVKDGEEYRYYVKDDEIIRYIKGKSFFRDQYDYGDPRITEDMNTKIYEGYGALFAVNP